MLETRGVAATKGRAMKQPLWIPVIAVFSALMSACGSLPVGNDAQIVSGTITALSSDRSSLSLQGRSFTLSGASVTVNGSDASARAISVGQRVRVIARGDRATGVDVSLELKGVVGAIDPTAMTITVAGVTVKYSATTRFDVSGDGDDDDSSSTSSIADIKAGMFVEVTGLTDATTGLIVASKIEVKTPDERGGDGVDDEDEIKGVVGNLNGSSFTIGEVSVNCTAPCQLPTGLKNGDFVEAEGRYDAATKTLTAKKVKFEDDAENENHHPITPGATVTLEHRLRNLNATAKTFKLECFVVDFSQATVTGGDIKDRARVKVTGVVDITDTRLVKASAVTVVADHSGDDDDDGDDNGGHSGDDDDDGDDDHGGSEPK
jgi:hypothetical protein